MIIMMTIFLQSLDPPWHYKEVTGKHLKSLRCKTSLSKEFNQTGYLNANLILAFVMASFQRALQNKDV